ncbi:MAG: hypothetical protein J6W80_05275 [Kiritimatiellae bacterium]|nr:hypothetical protein [Kiritimatiellia bacterium]
MKLADILSARSRFGIKPGLDSISALCAALGDPQRKIPNVVHVAGTNGKGATAAFVDAALIAAGKRSARYVSPHLVRINERFFLDGKPLSDEILDSAAERVENAIASSPALSGVTYFELLTAVAFDVYSHSGCDCCVLETGLGGRLDATNVCEPAVTAITRIGLDHCDILGSTIEAIAAEKGGIIKKGVPVILGENVTAVRSVVESIAREKGAPFVYAPEAVRPEEVPGTLSIGGAFNRENAMTAMAVCKVLAEMDSSLDIGKMKLGFGRAVWPGRYQKVGRCIVDGAHNPPAAEALVRSIESDPSVDTPLTLVAGFCGDKDVDATLSILRRVADCAIPVKSSNPRSLDTGLLAEKMRKCSFSVLPAAKLADLPKIPSLVCGSLFLAGEALVAMGAYPWPSDRVDPNEKTSSQAYVELAARIFGIPPSSVSLDTAYGSQGWDSVNHLRLVMEAEEAFGVFYPIDRIPQIKTIRDLISLAEKRKD